MNGPDKRLIGELAASVVPDNTTIFIDSGSTTYNIIRHLGNKKGLTLVTHSLIAINEASRLKEINTISLGGIYNACWARSWGFPAWIPSGRFPSRPR